MRTTKAFAADETGMRPLEADLFGDNGADDVPEGHVRKGDYVVPEADVNRAERAFAERSPRSRRVDKKFRAPIVTSYGYWSRHQRGTDYPGVDTPTDDPEMAVTDQPGPRGRARMANRTDRESGGWLSALPKSRDPIEGFRAVTDKKIHLSELGDDLRDIVPRSMSFPDPLQLTRR